MMLKPSVLRDPPIAPLPRRTAQAITTGRDDAVLWNQLAEIKQMIRRADREALRSGGVPAGLAAQVTTAFDDLVHRVDAVVRAATPAAAAEIGAAVQSELLPYLLMAENGERWYAKPRGYAGDFLTIEKIYEDEARGLGRIGPLLDRCFLQIPAARAVQNRRGLLAGELRATMAACADRPARITSIACGPARELFDAYVAMADTRRLAATLIDLDDEALAYCAARCEALGLADQLTLARANVVHLALGRKTIQLAEQDLVYSVGLVDYFKDELVVKLLDYIHGVLRPGGRVILGNFHPSNPTKAVMDHVLDWKLIHRDEDDMHALFRASAFGAHCSRILYEPQRINLFAEGIKR